MTQQPTTLVEQQQQQAKWKSWLQQLLALVGLVLIFLVFTIAAPGTFATKENITTIVFSAVVIGLIALGATLVIITSGIDLSCGTGLAFTGAITTIAIVQWGMPVPLGIVVGLCSGILLGVVNGSMVALMGLPPFIATLSTMMIIGGLALVITDVHPIYYSKDVADQSWFLWMSTGEVIPSVPNAIWVLVLAAVVAYIIANKTIIGRYDVSIGSNAEATALSGVNVKKWIIVIYAIAGFFTALGGIMMCARLGSVQPQTGSGYEMQAIASAVIGGTSLAGGKGSIPGTIIGALIISTINNGLRILSLPQQWQNVVLGLVIIATVFIDQLRTKQAKNA
ncbi:MAG: ABC transporter permease [Propionibacteriaceae bacterium]|jgi:ribose transport system permease protein|nr:ABC transporter permease [Propionibacteriaceae bacterium]